MLIHCCYRLIPNGEVIHSKFDSDTKLVDGLPLDWLDTRQLPTPVFNFANYRTANSDFKKMCEAVLLSNKDFSFVLESNNVGYYVLQWDGVWRFLDCPTDTSDKFVYSLLPKQSLFTAIGYRVTKLNQYRSCDGVYRLTLRKGTNEVYTNDGVLNLKFDMVDLSKISYNYAGYKHCVEHGAYAVVYIKDIPVFIYKDGDNLII